MLFFKINDLLLAPAISKSYCPPCNIQGVWQRVANSEKTFIFPISESLCMSVYFETLRRNLVEMEDPHDMRPKLNIICFYSIVTLNSYYQQIIHTTSEPIVMFNSMNQRFWAQNVLNYIIKIIIKNATFPNHLESTTIVARQQVTIFR